MKYVCDVCGCDADDITSKSNICWVERSYKEQKETRRQNASWLFF